MSVKSIIKPRPRRQLTKRKIQILSHLRHGNIPIKFQYDGIGATRYDNLCRDPIYISNSELGLLRDNSDSLLQTIKNKILTSQSTDINVIDVGCGNGEAGAIVLSNFITDSSSIRLRYAALDISGRMMSIAKKTIDTRFNSNKEHKVVELFSRSIDFEHDEIFNQIWRFSRIKNSINIFLFLGNTLGNYSRLDDQIRILLNMSRAMRPTDFLIVGVELFIKRLPNSLVEMYSNPLVIDFLSTVLRLFHVEPDRGEHKGYGKIEPKLVHDKDVDIKFRFTDACTIYGSVEDEDILFHIGDKIRLADSTRFHLEEVKQIILPAADLNVCEKEITDITGSALLLCCLKEFSGQREGEYESGIS
jgi:uncharacterized SAM-dependent methyltransferase